MKYQSQKISLAYFVVAMALFAVQVTMGLVLGWIYVSPNFLSEIMPFNIGRMLHTNSLIVWLLSDASRFVTGITVPIDGGFSAFSGV